MCSMTTLSWAEALCHRPQRMTDWLSGAIVLGESPAAAGEEEGETCRRRYVPMFRKTFRRCTRCASRPGPTATTPRISFVTGNFSATSMPDHRSEEHTSELQ